MGQLLWKKKNIIFPYKNQNAFYIWTRNCTLGHFFQIKKKIYPHKSLYINIQSRLISNSQKLKLYNVLNQVDTSQGTILSEKKVIKKHWILYNSIYITFLKWKKNYGAHICHCFRKRWENTMGLAVKG